MILRGNIYLKRAFLGTSAETVTWFPSWLQNRNQKVPWITRVFIDLTKNVKRNFWTDEIQINYENYYYFSKVVRIKGKGPIFMIYQLIDEVGFPMPFSTAVIMIVMKIKNA